MQFKDLIYYSNPIPYEGALERILKKKGIKKGDKVYVLPFENTIYRATYKGGTRLDIKVPSNITYCVEPLVIHELVAKTKKKLIENYKKFKLRMLKVEEDNIKDQIKELKDLKIT